MLDPHCPVLAQYLTNPTAPGSVREVPQYVQFFSPTTTTTALDQCVAEQRFVRGGMTRTLLYSQVCASLLLGC